MAYFSFDFVRIQGAGCVNVTWFATENLVVGDNIFTPGGGHDTAETTMYSYQMMNATPPASGLLALLDLAGISRGVVSCPSLRHRAAILHRATWSGYASGRA